MPARAGRIHPASCTPHVSTWVIGALAALWYVGRQLAVGELPLRHALGAGADDRLLLRAERGGLRRLLPPRAVQVGARTCSSSGWRRGLGAAILGYCWSSSVIDLSDPEASYSGSAVLGVGVPLFIGLAFLAARRRADGGLADRRSAAATSSARFEALPHDFDPASRRRCWPRIGLMASGVVLGFDDSDGSRAALGRRSRSPRRLGEALHVAFAAAPRPRRRGGARAPARRSRSRARPAGRGARRRRAAGVRGRDRTWAPSAPSTCCCASPASSTRA